MIWLSCTFSVIPCNNLLKTRDIYIDIPTACNDFDYSFNFSSHSSYINETICNISFSFLFLFFSVISRWLSWYQSFRFVSIQLRFNQKKPFDLDDSFTRSCLIFFSQSSNLKHRGDIYSSFFLEVHISFFNLDNKLW